MMLKRSQLPERSLKASTTTSALSTNPDWWIGRPRRLLSRRSLSNCYSHP